MPRHTLDDFIFERMSQFSGALLPDMTPESYAAFAKWGRTLQKFGFSIEGAETEMLGASGRYMVSRRGKRGHLTLPLGGETYKEGRLVPTGAFTSVKELNPLTGGVFSFEDRVRQALRGGGSISSIRRAINKSRELLRYEDIVDDGGMFRTMTALPFLNQYRFRVGAGLGDIRTADMHLARRQVRLLQQMANFNDLGTFYTPGSAGRGIGDLDIAGAQARLESATSSVIGAMGDMGVKMHLDPLSERSAFTGSFSAFGSADIDPLGRFRHGGFKIAQQFRLRAMKAPKGPVAQGLGQFGRLAFAGRLLTTGLIQEGLRHRPIPSAHPGGAVLSGMNVPTRVFFGANASRIFSGEDQIILDKLWAREMAGSLGRQRAKMGWALHGQGNFGKSNVAGVARLAPDIGAYKFGKLSKLGDIFDVFMGGYMMEMSRMGMDQRHMVRNIKQAFGSKYFRQNDLDRAIVNNFEFRGGGYKFLPGRALFEGIRDPSDATAAMGQVFSHFSRVTGKRVTDLIQKRNGMQFVDTLMHFGVRENAFQYWRNAVGMGINLSRGVRLGDNFAAIARASGSPTLGRFFQNVMDDPNLMRFAGFGRGAIASQAHLIEGMNQYKVSGMGQALDYMTLARRPGMAGLMESIERTVKTQHGSMVGVSRMVKESGLLGELYGAAPGAMIKLPTEMAVSGMIGSGDTSLNFAGRLQQIAVANLGRDDRLAYNTVRLLSGQDVEGALAGIARFNFERFGGGKGSLAHQLGMPRLGSMITSMAQTPTSLNKMPTTSVFNKMITDAGLDPSQGRYVFMGAHKKKLLSESQRAFYKQHGYLPALSVRYPATGRQFVAQRMVFSNRVSGNAGLMAAGDINYLMGDVDRDEVAHIIAAGDGQRAQRLYESFRELEGSQLKRLKVEDAYMARMIATKGAEYGEGVSAIARELEYGRGHGGEVAAKLISQISEEEIKRGQFAQLSTKVLTGIIDPEVKLRQVALDAMQRHGKSPFTAAGAEALSLGFMPGLLESAIGKRVGGGSIQMLARLNTSIKAGSTNKGAMRETALNMFRTIYGEFATEKGMSPLAAVSGDVLGFDIFKGGAYISADEFNKQFTLKNAKVSAFIDQYIDFETQLHGITNNAYGIGQALRNAPNKFVGGSKKRLGMIQQALEEAPGADLDPVMRDIRRAMRIDINTDVQISEIISEAMSKTPASKPAEQFIGDSAWEFAKSTYGSMSRAIKHNPYTAIGIAGLAAAGITAMAINKVNRGMEHVAGQMQPMTATPRTEYIMPEEAQAGMTLSGSFSAPPETIMSTAGMLNRLGNITDIRVVDSRRPVSDRQIGYSTQDRMSSIYGRPAF